MANPEAPGPNIEERIKILAETNDRLQEQISNGINRVLKFTNLYFVFQGMVFSSVMSSSTKINCKLRWIPFTLSLLVSIFNFLAVWENIITSLEVYKVVVGNLNKLAFLRELECGGSNAEEGPQPSESRPSPPESRSSPHSYKLKLRKAVSYLTLLLLLAFMGVMLCGCFQIECV